MKEKKLNGFFKHLKKTYKYAGRREKRHLGLFIVDAILICVLKVVIPLFTAKRIVYLTDSAWKQLFIVTFVILVSDVFFNIIRYLSDKHFNYYYMGTKKNLQLKLASETLKINTKTMNENSSGMFVDRMSTDVSNMTTIFIELIDYVTSLITSIGVLIAIFFLNKYIFLLYFVFAIVLFFVQFNRASTIQKLNKENRKISEKLVGFATELVRGSKDIKLLNAESSFMEKAEGEVDKMSKSDYELDMTWCRFRMINGSIFDLVDFTIMGVGIIFLMYGQLSIAVTLVIINYRREILNMSDVAERLIERVKKYLVSSERVFDIIEGDKYPKEVFGDRHINKLKGYIEFKDVSFKYDDNQVLKNINFKIKPNETIAFVGKSGAGKTTIYNLISKLYDVNSGEILLDDVNINDLDVETIRGNISVISQNPYIFNMSIKDNLKITKSKVTDDEIVSACKMACLHDFIVSLKDGYDTIVGESGVTLSGGQRQRLAIARALIQNTEIILFDEATSALDNETQANIQKAIDNMQGTYTILIIAHRLSTVIGADKIFWIEDGKVADVGSHEELLKSNENYRNLYELELN
ncbi:MAG: ABC transporter ATP-binding protein [Bacilli bacterium]|nr:ABC transporter ATP-binding protein [Bacilli bacterium]